MPSRRKRGSRSKKGSPCILVVIYYNISDNMMNWGDPLGWFELQVRGIQFRPAGPAGRTD
jgi:hypothetical protein